MTLSIRVPASTANLGPGFDIFGLALTLYNTFHVSTGGTGLEITTSGEGADLLPRDKSNLFYRVLQKVFLQRVKPMPNLRIKMEINVPPARGFGSSATAIVGALLAAHTLLGDKIHKADLVTEAWYYELGQHPDNVTAALLGGMVINVVDEKGNLITTPIAFPEGLKIVCYVPDFLMDTVAGRALMPAAYPRDDVVFSTSRVALLMEALRTKRFDLLRVAMQDCIHQPYRTRIFPAMPHLIEAALAAGAHGASLSGGGPTILAFATTDTEQVGATLEAEGRSHQLSGHSLILSVDHEGAVVTIP